MVVEDLEEQADGGYEGGAVTIPSSVSVSSRGMRGVRYGREGVPRRTHPRHSPPA